MKRTAGSVDFTTVCNIIDFSKSSTTNIRGDEEAEDDAIAFANSLTEPELEELKAMVHSDYIYSRLVQSIAPTVYGAELALFPQMRFLHGTQVTNWSKRGYCCSSWVVSTNAPPKACTFAATLLGQKLHKLNSCA